MSHPQFDRLTVYFDRNGRLTAAGWTVFMALLDYIRSLEARIEALEP